MIHKLEIRFYRVQILINMCDNNDDISKATE